MRSIASRTMRNWPILRDAASRLLRMRASGFVMAGLVPAINALAELQRCKDVDARHKAGHDEEINCLIKILDFRSVLGIYSNLQNSRGNGTAAGVERPEAPLLPHVWRSGTPLSVPAGPLCSVKSASQALWRLPALHFLLGRRDKKRRRGAGDISREGRCVSA
jgi:hypothetical protein